MRQMARQYSLKSFLRRASNALLKRYLAEQAIAVDVPWDHLGEREIEQVFAKIEGAPEKTRRRIDRDFREIDEMADEGGVKTLVEEARDPHNELDLTEAFGGMDSHLERVLWTFLEHPKVFDVARRFHYADSLGRWRKRDQLPPAEPAIEEESQQRLGHTISAYYRQKEGRGHACQVDHYRRGDRLYWFTYPEDYAVGRLVYTDDHKLESQTQRPAFEVIFVYSAEEKSLDIYVRGNKKTLLDLQRIFGRAILGVELEDPGETGVVYELSALLARDFPFALEPEDGIQEVRVRRLRLDIMGREGKRITLQADTRSGPKAVYDLLDDVLAGDRIPLDLLNVTQAGLQLVFRSEDGGRPQTLSFDVSYPNSCSLKYDPKHDIAKVCLKRWGLDVSGRGEPGPAKRRRSAQYCIPS